MHKLVNIVLYNAGLILGQVQPLAGQVGLSFTKTTAGGVRFGFWFYLAGRVELVFNLGRDLPSTYPMWR